MELAKILIIDDERMTLEIIKKILFAWNYSVADASDSKTAINMFSKEKYDLLIIDLHMTGIDSFELSKQAKQLNSNIKVIFITFLGYNYEPQIKQLMADGICNGCLYKPFSIKDLKKVIEKTLFKEAIKC